MQKTEDIFLKVNHLFFSRDDYYLFRDFSMELSSGQWVVLRGENGSGKSTLLKLIVGQLLPESGKIELVPFCYVGHKNAQRSTLTIEEQIRTKMAFLNVSMPIEDVLKRANLYLLKDIEIARLSAGIQRRVALTECLFTPHKLWILDEPFSYLDRNSKDIYLEIFSQHVKNGGTILQADHEVLPIKYSYQEQFLGINSQL